MFENEWGEDLWPGASEDNLQNAIEGTRADQAQRERHTLASPTPPHESDCNQYGQGDPYPASRPGDGQHHCIYPWAAVSMDGQHHGRIPRETLFQPNVTCQLKE